MSGSADAFCSFTGAIYCSPTWDRLNYKAGNYAESTASDGAFSVLRGCVKGDPNPTRGTCGCAPPCDDGTSDGDGGSKDPLDEPSDGDSGCGDYTNPCTPIVINLEAGVIRLSGLDDPVGFDLDDDGFVETLSWTERGSEVAFLVYDRDGDGLIRRGEELFGAFTPQPASDDPNGFRALAMFDEAALGGNEDGWITAEDALFSELRLWVDGDHDAVAESHELFPLAEHGIDAVELGYVEHRWRDRHGNEFRYSSRVRFDGGRASRAVDVFLLSGSP